MQQINFIYLFLAALIPIVVGFIWYSKPLFASSWMRVANLREEDLKKGNMIVILILTLILSFMLATSLMSITIHQLGIYSVLANDPTLKDPNSETSMYIADFMSKYGRNFRTFKHGAFHGTLAALFIALPILGINAMFERRGFKYVAIHMGYWIITLALMGGIVCAFV